MEKTALFYPDIRIDIGGYTFTQGVQLEINSSKTSYFDWASIRFTHEFQEEINIRNRALAQIALGYSGELQDVFSGYVVQPYNQASAADEILLRDRMILLEETEITCTFRAATPQEIIRYCLGRAGVTKMQVASTLYQAKEIVSIVRKNVIEVIKEVQRIWNITTTFYFLGDIFYWGTAPEQTKIYKFEYGINILSMKRIGGVWQLETVSVPMLRHSHQIDIVHPQLTGRFEVESVKYTTNSAGFLRTYLIVKGNA